MDEQQLRQLKPELDRFLAGLNAAREQKIDNGLADSLVHQWPAILAQIAPNAKVERVSERV